MTAGLFGLWSHLLAATLYGALALWQLRQWKRDQRGRALITAFAVMSVWAIFMALLDPYRILPQLADSGRNLAFLAFMYGILQGAGEDDRQRAVKGVYAAVAAAIGLQIVVGGLLSEFERTPGIFAALVSTLHLLGLVIASGALILVHNLYGQASSETREGIRLPMIALAAMWAFDLHLHTVAYFSGGPADALFAMRGALVAALVPLFALAIKRGGEWRVQLSRAATFQSVSILTILAYLIAMMAAVRAVEIAGGDWAQLGQIIIVAAGSLVALILLPSPRLRAWLRVVTMKHFFEHRYDYRTEWLRFTHTVGRRGEDDAAIAARAVKALADIAGSPAGVLLLADESRRLAPALRWNWPDAPEGMEADDGLFGAFLESTGYIVDFDAYSGVTPEGAVIPVPDVVAALGQAWAGIPLVHADRLVGLVVLRHPSMRRPLDWEDFDLFRAAGMQAASYIAEARTQQALADARRFDEFNRRFAFIMHDIKNLVSQLSLVARNAERHADNPDFRADMIATLQASVRKMNELLARLSQGKRGGAAPPRPVMVEAVLATVAESKRRAHPVTWSAASGLRIMADPIALEQALAHLVQNAIDASPADAPVRIEALAKGDDVSIAVIDSGTGMSADFIRTRLFQPFASTKEGGFGIGAFEARALIEAMGGRLEVTSREGIGSRFTLSLPSAGSIPAEQPERMRA